MSLTVCAVMFYIGWFLAARRCYRTEHRPRLLALMGERPCLSESEEITPQTSLWCCVETGMLAAGICGCVGCRRTWPDDENKQARLYLPVCTPTDRRLSTSTLGQTAWEYLGI